MTAILLVEDNPITRKMERFALIKAGFEVIDVDGGAAALRAFRSRDFALVLLDLVLPDMSGFDVLEQIRDLSGGAEVPIVAVSGLLSKLDEARMSRVGFDDVISKPVEPSRLLQIVRAHLPAPDSAAESFGAGRRLVVADDDPVQRKLAAFRLGRAGFEIAEAADGVAALALTRELRPAAVVSDVLMPELDGFGLCMEIRRDREIAATPLILVTNSYVDAADRDLARRSGADTLVLRTPGMEAVIDALRTNLAAETANRAIPVRDAEIEHERMRRMAKQLERQVALNAKMSRRCAFLATELAVLSGISEALASHNDIDRALELVLAACCDAGGISVGGLWLVDDTGARTIWFGTPAPCSEPELRALVVAAGLEGSADPHAVTAAPAGLGPAELTGALIAPLGFKGTPLGALITASTDGAALSEDRLYFTRAVAAQISQALALARAFAARAASEREARAKATVLRSIIESMADGVIVADESGEIIHSNKAASAILGREPGSMTADELARGHRLHGADQVTPAELPLARAMRGESLDGVELVLRRDDGDDAWLSLNARPLVDDLGHSHGGVMVFRDVTREKAARTQLMVSDRMASIGVLAAGVAHEINNPLAAVVANLELVSRDLGERDSALRDEVADAREAADRVRQIVRDLKIFSRAEDDRAEAVDVRAVLDSSARMAWNEIRHRARLVKDYAELPPVSANESRLGQVFLNLIVNAAQAIAEGHADENEIRLTARQLGPDKIAIEIADTGVGMPPEIQARLFTPFFTTKPAGVGTGLGLAICKRLVEAMGGEIGVESEPGRGTVFRVVLPAASPSVPVAAARRDPAATVVRRGKLLVIDDEPMISRVVKRLFSAEHDVVTTTDAREALARISAGARFDVILCDLMMPVVTGLDFYRELVDLAPDQLDAVIFVTGGAFTAQARAFLDQVPNLRIEKPFDFQELRSVINERLA